MGRLGEALVDGGNPFGDVKNIAPGGSVSDGPIGTHLTGFSIDGTTPKLWWTSVKREPLLQERLSFYTEFNVDL